MIGSRASPGTHSGHGFFDAYRYGFSQLMWCLPEHIRPDLRRFGFEIPYSRDPVTNRPQYPCIGGDPAALLGQWSPFWPFSQCAQAVSPSDMGSTTSASEIARTVAARRRGQENGPAIRHTHSLDAARAQAQAAQAAQRARQLRQNEIEQGARAARCVGQRNRHMMRTNPGQAERQGHSLMTTFLNTGSCSGKDEPAEGAYPQTPGAPQLLRSRPQQEDADLRDAMRLSLAASTPGVSAPVPVPNDATGEGSSRMHHGHHGTPTGIPPPHFDDSDDDE
jgi:hypothetical protein